MTVDSGGAWGAGGVAAGTVNDGRGPTTGLMTRRAGASGAGAGGAATIFSAGGATVGVGAFGTAAGGTATGFGGGGAAGASALRRNKLATSPGFEMCERSILVLIAGSAVRDPPSLAVAPPPCPAKCLRTRSASSTSMELECVFFSVTPTLERTSRIALLLTSSSLARSLIRTLLIRPVFSPLSRYTIITTLTRSIDQYFCQPAFTRLGRPFSSTNHSVCSGLLASSG